MLIFAILFIQGCTELRVLKVSKVNAIKSVRDAQSLAQPKYGLDKSDRLKVLAVSDGDTIAVTLSGKRTSIRFACVDAPEVNHGANRPGQPLGDRAKQKLKELVDKSGGAVRLKITDTDRYGRKVAEVFLSDNATAQEHLALAGLAWPYEQYKQNCPSWDAVKAASEAAKRDRLGIYSSSENIPPWEWRHTRWR
jgi:endonuclease YncB( thermonuclease family)